MPVCALDFFLLLKSFCSGRVAARFTRISCLFLYVPSTRTAMRQKRALIFPFFVVVCGDAYKGHHPVGTHSRTSNTVRLRGIALHECVVRHHFVTPSRHRHVNVTHHLCAVSTAITMTAMTGIPDGPHTWEVSSETNLTFLVVIMTMFANFSAFIFFNRFYRARENDR